MQIYKSFTFCFLLKQISFQSYYLIHILSSNTSKARILNIALCDQENCSEFHMKASISSFHQACMWGLPCHMNKLLNVQGKKVSPFISGPFSKTCYFFWNWKFKPEKGTAFLVAFYILAADRPTEVSPRCREHPDRLPSARCFAALATLFCSEVCTSVQLPALLICLFLI